MPNFKPVQNTSLPEAIAEQIIAQIVAGQLKPGDRLPTETELMAQFNVGRSTLREALKSLAMAGLIETRRSAGTFVSQSYTGFLSERLKWGVMFSERDLRNIVDVRHALEGQTARLAAERATAQQKATLAELIDRLEAGVSDPDLATELDTAFHVSIAQASHNPLLLSLILSIRSLIREYIKLGYTDRVQPDTTASDHRRILDAIRAGRPEEATKAMVDHLGSSAELMLALARDRQKKG